MSSELQRVAQGLVDSLDQIPAMVAYLQRTVSKLRQQATYIAALSPSNQACQNAALQVEAAAKACEDTAQLASLAPPKARAWAEQMVTGARHSTKEPASSTPGGPPGRKMFG